MEPGDRVLLPSGSLATVERVLESTVMVREDGGRVLQVSQRRIQAAPAAEVQARR